ncbi:hypothetical protein DSM106972_005040 [Dulcicalothrix desertica PCC 7102]|uniref:Uncharacterized protein n=2 Tax=Dulcicalothrix desertica TaxID=32056 RepID=A0A3S1DHG2_9CYAN|nr:hypothetical protein DSM106972_005040 [Dulcicalothrix desertica PCC 7102]TWH41012.1 hypothetical protein CAL7102_10377 [Dulcicalothrix desertica PCC 7102]
MLINDLSYLKNTQENDLIFGGADIFIVANATAGGNNSLTLTDVNIDSTTKKNGVSKVTGTGLAIAIGEDPTVDTDYGLEGFDRAKVKTRYRGGDNYAIETVRIKATDRP